MVRGYTLTIATRYNILSVKNDEYFVFIYFYSIYV